MAKTQNPRRRGGKGEYRTLTVNLTIEMCQAIDALALRRFHDNRSMAAEAAFQLLLDRYEDRSTEG